VVTAQSNQCSISNAYECEDENPVSQRDRKSPDTSFKVDGCAYPRFVLEVGYSQKSHALAKLADYYTEHSGGNIHTILTVDIEYRPLGSRQMGRGLVREAVYSIYRQHIDRDDNSNPVRRYAFAEVENQHFRTDQNEVPNGTLELRLSEFFSPAELDLQHVDDQSISISHHELASLLAKAEKFDRDTSTMNAMASMAEASIPYESKRKRSPTPSYS
jgi:hypothetical protein